VEKYAQRMNKKIETIPEETLSALRRHSWPGNIRELQNLIERAVIMTPGSVLDLAIDDLSHSTSTASTGSTATTLEDMERERILQVLQETGAVIGGPQGAAARLGLKRTTLLSKMQRLGISRSTKYDSMN
jgi:formate hydrogenlyase transcriptional activator